IKERRDYSCAVFDPQGRLVAQAAHIPVHLGAMPTAVEAAMPLAPFATGDIVILNDPYLGGTHLPDITMVSPVFVRRTLAGFVASRAHHADVGGTSRFHANRRRTDPGGDGDPANKVVRARPSEQRCSGPADSQHARARGTQGRLRCASCRAAHRSG